MISDYAEERLRADETERPKKKIRPASTIDTMNSLNTCGIEALQEGKFLQAEQYWMEALCRVDVGYLCETIQSSMVTTRHTSIVPLVVPRLEEESKQLDSAPKQVGSDTGSGMHQSFMLAYQQYDYDEGMDVFQEPESITDIFDAESISARLYYNLGLVKVAQGEITDAFSRFEKSLSKAQASSKKESFFKFQLWHKLGYCRFRLGNLSKAMECFQTAFQLSIQDSLHKIATAACFNSLGVLHFHNHRDDSEKAMLLLKQSLAIYRDTFGNQSKEVATVLNNIGRIHYLWSEYKKALEVYAETLSIRVAVLGEDSLDVAATIYNTGQSYHQLGQLDNAMEYYQRFLRISTKSLGPNSRDVAIAYRGMAEIHQEKRELKLAFKLFKSALEVGQKAQGKFHPEIASILNKLGNLCYEMKDLISALKYYREGLEIETVILEPEHRHVIITMTNIAHIEKQRRNYRAALDAYSEVYKKQLKSGEDDIMIAVTLSSLGLVQYHLNMFEEAFESYQEALRLRRDHFGTDDNQDIASTLNSIGLVLFKQNMFELAKNCFTESLRIRTKLLGKDHRDVAILWYNIATIYFETGNDELAIRMYKETLRVERIALGPEHSDVVLTLQHIGQILQQLGHLDEALLYFIEALKIEKKKKRDEISVAKILNLMGNIFLQKGNVKPMMESFTEASRLLERCGRAGEALVIAGYNFYGLAKTNPPCAPIA